VELPAAQLSTEIASYSALIDLRRTLRRICVYLVDVIDAAPLGEDAKTFDRDPERLLYCLRWKIRRRHSNLP
jgi:hypothetical protein